MSSPASADATTGGEDRIACPGPSQDNAEAGDQNAVPGASHSISAPGTAPKTALVSADEAGGEGDA